MINLIIFRKDRLIERGAFKDQNHIDDHIKNIEIENLLHIQLMIIVIKERMILISFYILINY